MKTWGSYERYPLHGRSKQRRRAGRKGRRTPESNDMAVSKITPMKLREVAGPAAYGGGEEDSLEYVGTQQVQRSEPRTVRVKAFSQGGIIGKPSGGGK